MTSGARPILGLLLYLAIVALVAWFCVGCGPQPDYTTRHGIDVYEQGAEADQADIEEITRVALDLWPTDPAGLVLRLRAEPIQYAGDSHEYYGTFAKGTLTVWAEQHDCFARGTYGHELLHAISWIETGDADRRHEVVGPLDRELRRQTIGWMCP